MRLRAAANRMTARVNPNLAATLLVSRGYTTAPTGKREPIYDEPVQVSVQVQTLTQSELEHLDRLNISNGQASVFIDRQLSSVDRTTGSGGDMLTFGSDALTPPELRSTTWLVVALLEGWPGSAWCKAAITSQMP